MLKPYDLKELNDVAESELLLEMISIGEDFKAFDLFGAVLERLKMAKVNMTWLRNQVWSCEKKLSILTAVSLQCSPWI